MIIKKESNGTVTIDGRGTLLFTKHNHAIKVIGQCHANVKHWTIIGKGMNNQSKIPFFEKLRHLKTLWEFLSSPMKYKSEHYVGKEINYNGRKAIVENVFTVKENEDCSITVEYGIVFLSKRSNKPTNERLLIYQYE